MVFKNYLSKINYCLLKVSFFHCCSWTKFSIFDFPFDNDCWKKFYCSNLFQMWIRLSDMPLVITFRITAPQRMPKLYFQLKGKNAMLMLLSQFDINFNWSLCRILSCSCYSLKHGFSVVQSLHTRNTALKVTLYLST